MEKFSQEQNKLKYEREGKDLIAEWAEISYKVAVIACITKVQGYFRRYNSEAEKAKNETDILKSMHSTSTSNQIEPHSKKGNIPHNTKPIGTERISKEGYTEVKTTERGRWEMKHNIIYKQHFGEIPPAHVVSFKDKNKQNFDITNLECISRAELARRNYNPTKTGMTNSKHYQKIKTAILLGKQITPEMPFAKKFI